MVIAINTVVAKKNNLLSYMHFLQEVLITIASEHSEHQFVFIVDKPAGYINPNTKTIIFNKRSRLNFINKIFFKRLITKLQPQLLVNLGDYEFFVNNIQQLVPYQKKAYLKLSKAQSKNCFFITNSLANKKEAQESKPQTNLQNIDVVYEAASACFKPLMFNDVMQVKDGYADGREYFLCSNDIVCEEEFINVLKAFSLFKKWQHSNMKLLIAGDLSNVKDMAYDRLSTYKYKDDVVLLNKLNKPEMAKLTASAYCVLFLPLQPQSMMPVVEAMQCGTPVIASNFDSITELAEQSFLYSNSNSPEEIAEKMQNIYKDENLRSDLIKGVLMQSKKYNYNVSAIKMWEIIQHLCAEKI